MGAVRLVEAGGASIAVREWGDPAGRPMIFLHGLGPLNSSAFAGLCAEALVDAGFRVVGIDLPGFGASPARSDDAYELPRLGELVWEVADACRLQRPVILGHSWGGTIACFAAAARPDGVGALVLGDAGHRDWDDPSDTPVEEIIQLAEGVRLRAADAAAVAVELEVSVDDPLVEVVLAALIDDGAGGLVSRASGEVLGTARYYALRAKPSGTWGVLGSAGVPTLLLLATVPEEAREENEAAVPEFRAAVSEADIRLLHGVSHQMIMDMRDEFGVVVAEWLGRMLP